MTIVLLILGSIPYVTVTTMTSNWEKGSITLEFMLDKPLPLAKLYVQVFALRPSATSVEVFRGEVKGRLVIDLSNKVFRDVINEWVNTLNAEGASEYVKEETYTALIVNAWLLLPGCRSYRALIDKTVLYSPVKLLKGKDSVRVSYVLRVNDIIKEENRVKPLHENKNVKPNEPYCYIWWVKDESKSYTITNVKIPLVIVYNDASQQSPLYAQYMIEISSGIEAKLGISYGYNLDSNGLAAPEFKATIGGTTYATYAFSGDSTLIYPGEVKWFWVKGDITSELWRELNVCYGYTGYQSEKVYVSRVYVSGTQILGGISEGWPSWIEELFENSQPSYYGTLEPNYPNNAVSLRQISQSYDSCNAGISIGVSLGAILALAAPTTIPAALLAVIASLVVDIESYAYLYITGLIRNEGNVAVDLIVYVSKIKYSFWTGWYTCRMNIPVYYITTI
mgnify:CR=1 FL=1